MFLIIFKGLSVAKICLRPDSPPFLNSEGPYLTERILYNLCGCFDFVFAQLGVIPRTRKKFVERVVVAERYFIISNVKNKESEKQPFRICLPVKLAEGRISIKMKKFLRT